MAKKKRKTFSVTINRNFLATIAVTIDVKASSEEEAKELALQKAKDNEIPAEEYNFDGLNSQASETVHSDSYDGEPEIADISDSLED